MHQLKVWDIWYVYTPYDSWIHMKKWYNNFKPMETPTNSAIRKFPDSTEKQQHYIKLLEWLISKWKPHKSAIKIAKYSTIKHFKWLN